jgi:heme/copper-type cytochrome/quinol oxidase subunit 2
VTRRRVAILVAVGLLAVVVVTVPSASPVTPPGEREVRVRARQYAYEPAMVRASRGDRVTVVLEAEDMTHGLYVDGYDREVVAVPGQPARLTFIADRPGKFRLRCSRVCGPLHPFMLGDLIVEPYDGFWRAAALTVLAATGTVLYLLAGPREGPA